MQATTQVGNGADQAVISLFADPGVASIDVREEFSRALEAEVDAEIPSTRSTPKTDKKKEDENYGGRDSAAPSFPALNSQIVAVIVDANRVGVDIQAPTIARTAEQIPPPKSGRSSDVAPSPSTLLSALEVERSGASVPSGPVGVVESGKTEVSHAAGSQIAAAQSENARKFEASAAAESKTDRARIEDPKGLAPSPSAGDMVPSQPTIRAGADDMRLSPPPAELQSSASGPALRNSNLAELGVTKDVAQVAPPNASATTASEEVCRDQERDPVPGRERPEAPTEELQAEILSLASAKGNETRELISGVAAADASARKTLHPGSGVTTDPKQVKGKKDAEELQAVGAANIKTDPLIASVAHDASVSNQMTPGLGAKTVTSSQRASVHEATSNTSQPHSAQDARDLQFTGSDRVSPETTALDAIRAVRMFEHAGHSELRIGVHSDALGSMDVKTTLHDGNVALSVVVDRHDVRSALLMELPGLENTLRSHDLRLGEVCLHDTSTSFSSGGDANQHGSQYQSASSSPLQWVRNLRTEVDELPMEIINTAIRGGLSIHA